MHFSTRERHCKTFTGVVVTGVFMRSLRTPQVTKGTMTMRVNGQCNWTVQMQSLRLLKLESDKVLLMIIDLSMMQGQRMWLLEAVNRYQKQNAGCL